MKYKLFIGNILKCTEYLVEEIDTKASRRYGDEEFSAGYKIVKPTVELESQGELFIKLSNGRFMRYSNVMGLNNTLNYLRLFQSDGPKVLEEQGYVLKDKPTKKGDSFVDSSSLSEFRGTKKKAKQYVLKREKKSN